MPYSLGDGIHFCIANRAVALLDVPKNRYFGLPRLADAAFQTATAGASLTKDEEGALAPLVARGILIQCEAGSLQKPPSKDATSDTTGYAVGCAQLLKLLPAFAACYPAMLAPSKRLDHILAHLRNRRRLAVSRPTPVVQVALAEALAELRSIRRLVGMGDRCLPWSIGAATVLYQHGIIADFVIGVRMRPFGAHAWVQLNGKVLNDDLDNVRPYTPILII